MTFRERFMEGTADFDEIFDLTAQGRLRDHQAFGSSGKIEFFSQDQKIT